MPEKITAQVGDKQIIMKPENSPNRRMARVTVQLGDTSSSWPAVAATKARKARSFSR